MRTLKLNLFAIFVSLFFVGTLRAQNVGIGTTTPGAKLMVVGNPGAPTLNILPDSASGMNPTIRANDNGRVGIGTTSPGARLMVIGTDGAPSLNISESMTMAE